MKHCASCTCEPGLSVYHARCPKCDEVTDKKLLKHFSGMCEACRLQTKKEERDANKQFTDGGTHGSGAGARLRRVG